MLSVFNDPFVNDPFFSNVADVWDPFYTEPILTSSTPSRRRRRSTAWSDNPPGINMDFLEKDNMYIVHADMPGYNKDDIQINVDSGVLHIHALKKELPAEEHGSYFRRERTWGRINRSLRLPLDCDTAGTTEVCYCNGVVTIKFPKLATSFSRMKKLMIK